jgi:hypothetical protein
VVTEQSGVTSVRLIALLDRSGDTEVAKPVAALFDAAAKAGGSGHIQLVNDGSYRGDGGVCVTIDQGKLVRSRLADARPLCKALVSAVYGPMDALLDEYASPRARTLDGESKPSAKKPSATKPSATKPSATKPSATKTSATKTSAKKPSATKPKAAR